MAASAKRLLDYYRLVVDDETIRKEKYVLLVLVRHMNEHSFISYPGLERIARKTGLAEKTVRKHLAALVQTGKIEVVNNHGDGKNTGYKLVMFADQGAVPGQQTYVEEKTDLPVPPYHPDSEESTLRTDGWVPDQVTYPNIYDEPVYDELVGGRKKPSLHLVPTGATPQLEEPEAEPPVNEDKRARDNEHLRSSAARYYPWRLYLERALKVGWTEQEASETYKMIGGKI